jgi:hypothetical protein
MAATNNGALMDCSAAPCPDGDDRLADRQDDEQPMSFGQMGHAVQPPVAVP